MNVVNGYTLTSLKNEITIKHIISVHYFEYSKNYIFEGERHNFWELLYVDKGEINVMADDVKYILQKGQIIFHQPNEWHNVIANGVVAPNLVVIAFNCNSKAMAFFKKRILSVDSKIQTYLSNIILEAKRSFISDLSDPLLSQLKKRKKSYFASEQLIRIYLELLLIDLIKNQELYQTEVKPSTSVKEYALEEKLTIVKRLLSEHVYSHLTLDDICKKTLLSRSTLQKLFKEGMNTSIMDYFKSLKIEEAKVLIREGNHNFTEIASMLGYNSIHYFSRTFKATTSMTPSEYASSVKARL